LAVATSRADLNYAGFTSTAGLNLLGDATQVGTALRLTRSQPDLVGAAWYTTKQSVAGGFETTFSLRISPFAYADGIAFVIQNQSATALGGTGGAKGYAGISNCIAVEFDEWNGDLSIQSKGTLPNAYTSDATLATTALPGIADGNPHTARVSYVQGVLRVFVDNLATPKLTLSTNLSQLLNLSSGTAWVGLSAGTGEGYEQHEILSWSFTESTALHIKKAVYLTADNVKVGTNYQVQVSADLNTWTNHGGPFTATNSTWRSTSYWDVENWNALFFRLQPQ
jgi:hypothetical protein